MQTIESLNANPNSWKPKSVLANSPLQGAHNWVHQAIAFAIASEFCHSLPFARDFRSEDDIFAISFAKPFAFASEFLRSAQFAAFCLRFGGQNSLANCRGASEFAFAFAFAAVSLRPQCTQAHKCSCDVPQWTFGGTQTGTKTNGCQNVKFSKPKERAILIPIRVVTPLGPAKVGACAMTTKFLDNKIFTFKILLSWRFPRKKRFGQFSSLPPCPSLPWKTQILFLLSSRFLWKRDTQTGTKINGYQNASFSEIKKLAILIPHRVDTPLVLDEALARRCLQLRGGEERFHLCLRFGCQTCWKNTSENLLEYCPRRNYYWITSEKGGSSNFQDLFTGVNDC